MFELLTQAYQTNNEIQYSKLPKKPIQISFYTADCIGHLSECNLGQGPTIKAKRQ